MDRARFAYEIIDPQRLIAPALRKALRKNPGFSWTAARVMVRSTEGPGTSVLTEVLHRPMTRRTAYACGERSAWTYTCSIEDAVEAYLNFLTASPPQRPN